MKREEWEELVDRVVDGECTVEEKQALDEAAERNPEIRDAIDAALRIRDLMRKSAGATVPPEFSERLRLAIERSDFWVEREIERPTVRPAATAVPSERRGRLSGRRFFWTATGAAVSFAAVALLASNVVELPRRNDGELARLDEARKIETTPDGLEAANPLEAPSNDSTTRPLLLRRPGNKGEAPKRVVATPSGFYTRRVLDSGAEKRLLADFLSVCRKNDVEYEKIDGDFELTLRQTTPEARRAILEWLDDNAPEVGERGETKLAERWNADDETVCDVRISFSVAER